MSGLMDRSERRKAYYQANKEKWRESRAKRTPEQRQRDIEYNRAWREANKHKYVEYREAAKSDGRAKAWDRAKSLKHKYGISVAEYDRLLTAQGGVCAICLEKCATHENLCVDHCHSTGKVRGLLCASCNIAIGRFKDNANIVRRAADYLETQG